MKKSQFKQHEYNRRVYEYQAIGMIAISLIILQAIISQQNLDTNLQRAAISFAIALPLLVRTVITGYITKLFEQRSRFTILDALLNPLGLSMAYLGVFFTLLHISNVIVIWFVISSLLAFIGTIVYIRPLERESVQDILLFSELFKKNRNSKDDK